MKKAKIPQKIIIAMLKMMSLQKQKKLCEHINNKRFCQYDRA